MNPELTVRLVTAADFDAIAAITNHFIRNTSTHFGYDEVTRDELRALWQQGHDTFPWLVADRGGAVVGYAKAGTWRARDAYRWTTESGIYLRPDATGQGIGPPLYRLAPVSIGTWGVAGYPVDYTAPPSVGGTIVPGSTWRFQFHYRDPDGGGAGFNLTEGLEILFGI